MSRFQNLLVTGAAGFIGSHFVELAAKCGHKIIILDKMTYAGSSLTLAKLEEQFNLDFFQMDISDTNRIKEIVLDHGIDAIVNFAAESHVDNSISDSSPFLKTNILGVASLLEVVRTVQSKKKIRFLQVSTDEVFGDLEEEGSFNPRTAYAPNSPYSSTKASADFLVRAWSRTYGLDAVISICSNNFGPRQSVEKLIPKTILCCLQQKEIPVYGKGMNVRDWIFVGTHCEGVYKTLIQAETGKTYLFGGESEIRNIDLVRKICSSMDRHLPEKKCESLIRFVEDRAGHDYRYAVDCSASKRELGFDSRRDHFDAHLESTIVWYISNPEWIRESLNSLEAK